MGTNIKKWPVGSPAQAALDALTVLMERERLGSGDVDAIELRLPANSARTVDNAAMPDINVQHLMAMLLIDRTLTFKSIHDASRVPDRRIRALRGKIALIGSDELMHARPRRQAIVSIRTRDGRTLAHRTVAVRGTADNPMTQAEVEAKAFDLIADVLGARRAEAIVQAIGSLETVADVTVLRRLWRPSPGRRPHAPLRGKPKGRVL